MDTTILNSPFISENFLLENKWSERLYHEYASKQPIVDFRSQLHPRLVAEDAYFSSCTPIWLDSDPMKLRAMRALGVSEEFITGESTELEKFVHWAAIVPYLVGNPLHHWTHLDLLRYFGFTERLDAGNAEEVFELTRELLHRPSHSTQGLLNRLRVEVLVTAMDPSESLAFHRTYSSRKQPEITMIPSFQPDAAYRLDDPREYRTYLERLGNISHQAIQSYDDLLLALRTRALDFHEMGCRSADHEIANIPSFEPGSYSVERIFKKIYEGNTLDPIEKAYFQFEILVELCGIYDELGWVQQFHLGGPGDREMKSLNPTRPALGLAGAADAPLSQSLLHLLNVLERKDRLAKTVFYPMNPSTREVLAVLAGSFNDGSSRGKMQVGLSGSHFLNELNITRHLDVVSQYGILSCFIGMASHSKSPLSYTHYEYFRRILCNHIGLGIEKGRLPADINWLGAIVSDISYDNAKNYFNL